jgi:hypothetical protein
MALKKCIVITTINSTNPCLEAFSKLEGWDLIIVGDKKSPKSYNLKATYLDVSEQEKLFPKFSRQMPFNHYCRKNLGYLYAIKNGYDIIGESDDDNLPYKNWGKLPQAEVFSTITEPSYPNLYKEFTEQKIWPRGFPLDLVLSNEPRVKKDLPAKVLVWQGLADGDTDVDAIYRLTIKQEVIFDKNKTVVLNANVLSPFNSQNTVWLKEAWPFLYLPHTVTFRYTDILRSFIAQFGIWNRGGVLGFMSPTASSIERNFHNLLRDFDDEVPMYNSFYKVIEALQSCHLTGRLEDLSVMYEALAKNRIIEESELDSISEWLRVMA